MKVDCIRSGYIYLSGEEKLNIGHKVLTKEMEDGELFICKTSIDGIFTYGYMQTEADPVYGHGPGYVWASRASVMNANFDVALMEACYKFEGSYSYRSCSIDLAHLEELLKDTEYEIDWTPHTSDNGDVHYKLKLKSKEVN